MALFKPFRGSRATLDAQEMHDGYAYFCTDDGSFHIDYVDADGNLQRKQINAKEAEALTGYNISTILNSSDVEIPTSKAVMDAIEDTKSDASNKAAVVLVEAQKGIDAVSALVGDTPVSDQIATAVSGLATETYVDEAIAAIPSSDGPQEFITLIDEVNTYEYRVVMRNGGLVSFARATKIEVTTMPDNTSVESLDAIDLTGMVVSVIRQDGTSSPIDNYIITSTEIVADNSYAIVNMEYTEYGETFTTYLGLGYTPFDPAIALVDFTYTTNADGTYTITGWKQTLNGTASTEMVFPDSSLVVL